MLKSAGKYREFEKQQLQSVIREKVIEFERLVCSSASLLSHVASSFARLRVEFESLQKTEREQSEKMEQLSLKAYVVPPPAHSSHRCIFHFLLLQRLKKILSFSSNTFIFPYSC